MEEFLIELDGRRGLRRPIKLDSSTVNIGDVIELDLGASGTVTPYEILDIKPGQILTSKAVGRKKQVPVQRTLVLRRLISE